MQNMISRCRAFISKPFFSDYRTLIGLWMIIAIIGIKSIGHAGGNNYLIFKYVFWHVVEQVNLYMPDPTHYFDVNHYGPTFSLVIAPFAVMPTWLGMLLWNIFLVLGLWLAVRHSGMSHYQQIFIYWFSCHELFNAVMMQQFNTAIAAIIIASFFLIEKEKDGWAAFLIVLGTVVKLYGIVGLAFFFFSKHKRRFILYFLLWTVVLVAAPMVISSPEYILSQYYAWMTALVEKNGENLESIKQNISVLGMVRRISGCETYSDLWILIPAMVLFFLPYLRIRQWKSLAFRETLLASVLMFVVLFSTGSENSTYIIAIPGVVLWYTAAPWKRGPWAVALMVYVFIFTTMAHSDLIISPLRNGLIRPYALKALPVTIVWLRLCWEMMTKEYRNQPLRGCSFINPKREEL